MKLYNVDIIYYFSSFAQLIVIHRYDILNIVRETKNFPSITMTIISLGRLYEYAKQNIRKFKV